MHYSVRHYCIIKDRWVVGNGAGMQANAEQLKEKENNWRALSASTIGIETGRQISNKDFTDLVMDRFRQQLGLYDVRSPHHS